MKALPNRLKIEDGHLVMIDGSDVVEYLRNNGLNGREVVILDRQQQTKLEEELEFLRLFYNSVAA